MTPDGATGTHPVK